MKFELPGFPATSAPPRRRTLAQWRREQSRRRRATEKRRATEQARARVTRDVERAARRAAANVPLSLTVNSKMPGKCFNVPAMACQTGGKLNLVKGSVCHDCYARRGLNMTFSARVSQMANLYRVQDAEREGFDTFVRDMSSLIGRIRVPFFRWHAAGDVQSVSHLDAIVRIARAVPHVRFWLPTKEYSFLREYLSEGRILPENLVIRVSAPMMNQSVASAWTLPVSSVTTTGSALPGARLCPAPDQNGECGECRACWSSDVREISYRIH